MTLSEKGKDFEGRKLNEDNLHSGVQVKWRNTIYTTGNRLGLHVELYKDGEFVRVVSTQHIRLVTI